jgi:hypothetical protein
VVKESAEKVRAARAIYRLAFAVWQEPEAFDADLARRGHAARAGEPGALDDLVDAVASREAARLRGEGDRAGYRRWRSPVYGPFTADVRDAAGEWLAARIAPAVRPNPRRTAGSTVKPRYTLPGARAARTMLLAELRRHGFDKVARAYAAGEIREKQVASRVGCAAEGAARRGDRAREKVARGVMLLASYLHEGKHARPASADALRTFWAHYDRVHGPSGKYPL